MPDRDILRKLDKETLIDLLEDSAKNWLAHDGLWFQAIETEYDISAAIKMDKIAWKYFTQVEAKRIMRRFDFEQGGGIDTLEKALSFRLYARLNEQALKRIDNKTLRYEMTECRVQKARERKKMTPFPCKPVGFIEYAYFAYTIDNRIRTSIITCPPDEKINNYYCAWLFELEESPITEEQLLPEGFHFD